MSAHNPERAATAPSGPSEPISDHREIDPSRSMRVRRIRGPNAPGLTGTMVRQHVAKLMQTFGRPLIESAIDGLRADDAEAIRQVSHMGWVPVEAIEELYESIAHAVHRDAGSLHWEIGRLCTAETLRTLWRVLLKLTSDEALVMRAPILYGKSYNHGKLRAEISGPGSAKLYLTEWPQTPQFVRRGLCIGITTVLELAGRKDVRVEPSAGPDGATFTVRWMA